MATNVGTQPYISIIVPCKTLDAYTMECVKHCLELDYQRYEILLLPDNHLNISLSGVKVIPTGMVKPPTKRNVGISQASGEICGFIDSDAFPAKDWINNALKYFDDPEVAAVGGPNLTPDEDSPMQKASGFVYSSLLGGGKFAFRYDVKASRQNDELPSCNLFIRRSVLVKLGGFDDDFLTAEDSKICFQICRMGKKVLYAPEVIVYHHRRPLFMPHLKQVWNYGRDKAFLFRKFPYLRKAFYFLPSLLVLWSVAGFCLSLASSPLKIIYTASILCYITAVLMTGIVTTVRTGDVRMATIVSIGIVLTHLTYGMSFIEGLLIRKT